MINLLPLSVKEEYRHSKLQKEVSLYGFIAILIVALAVGAQMAGKIHLTQLKDDLAQGIETRTSQLSEANTGQKEAKELSKNIDTIGELIERRVDFADLIQEIGSVLPSGSRLNSLSLGIDNSAPINMVFTVDSQLKAAVLRKNIEESGLFQGADIQNIAAGEIDEDGKIQTYNTSIITSFSSEYLKNKDKQSEEEPIVDNSKGQNEI